MKIYKNLAQLEADIKDNILIVNEDVTFEFSFSISASLKINGDINARNISAWDINAGNISAWDINAGNISAWDINARNISAWDINARNISARNISAWNISARNISARNISAWDINAGDILYYAFCSVYNSIKCISIKAERYKHQEPICLDGKLEFKTKESEVDEKKS